jgi:cytochrome c oxidase cbb3-type subunit 2
MSRHALLVLALVIAIAPIASLAAGDLAAGKKVFADNCALCHGEKGLGDGPGAANYPVRPRDFTKGEFKYDANKDGKSGEDADLKLIITNGAAAYGGDQLMAPWGAILKPTDIDNVIAVIRSLKAKK